MERTYTPHPWYIVRDRDNGMQLWGGEGETLIAVANEGVRGARAEANARLLAAAPTALIRLAEALNIDAVQLAEWLADGPPRAIVAATESALPRNWSDE